MKTKMEIEDDPARATLHETGRQRFRKIPPSHYIFKIESFTSLLEAKVEKYETKYFEVGGYKWRMVLYPNGQKNEGSDGHISLFLSIANPDTVSLGLEINVNVKFFVFDGIRDRYLVIQDADDKEWRYHKMMTEWGFTKLLSHDALNDPKNGYLVDDRCIFGVEVFVVKSSPVGESFSLVKEPNKGLYTWRIANYSALDENCLHSEVFTVEGRKWKLRLHPKGDSRTAGEHLSLFLILDYSETLESGRKVYAKFLLRIKSHTSCKDSEFRGTNRVFETPGCAWGWSKFSRLSTLKDPSKCYLVNDCVTIQAEFDFISSAKDFS